MNHTEFVFRDDNVVNFVCHTDGEPSDLYWVWEIDEKDVLDWLERYYGNRALAVLSKISKKVADQFVNDESLLEESDEYNCGKAPISGCWYAPLTMDQIERSFWG